MVDDIHAAIQKMAVCTFGIVLPSLVPGVLGILAQRAAGTSDIVQHLGPEAFAIAQQLFRRMPEIFLLVAPETLRILRQLVP